MACGHELHGLIKGGVKLTDGSIRWNLSVMRRWLARKSDARFINICQTKESKKNTYTPVGRTVGRPATE